MYHRMTVPEVPPPPLRSLPLPQDLFQPVLSVDLEVAIGSVVPLARRTRHRSLEEEGLEGVRLLEQRRVCLSANRSAIQNMW